MRVAVILAAGASIRMGRPKPLVRLADGRTFLEAEAAALRAGGVRGPVIVVTGACRSRIAAEARRLGLVPVHSRRHREGQLASARTGLRAALRAGGAAILVLPCDMPHLRGSTVRRLVARDPPAWPAHRGRPGHPLLLDAGTARAVLAIAGARSLREAMRQAGVRPRPVTVDDPAVRENVNREADLRRWERAQPNSPSRRPETSSATRLRMGPGTRSPNSSSRVSLSPATR